MALTGGGGLDGNRFAQTGVGFPPTGGQIREGGTSPRETREERDRRLTAEERADQEKLGDPTGLRQPAGGQQAGQTSKVVKKKILKRRVNNGQTEGTSNSGSAEGARRGGPNRGVAGQQGNQTLMQRTMGQSSLIQASISHKNNQAQNLNANNNGNPSNVAVRNQMLNGLGKYIQNDYQAMRLNPDDKAFTYRTAEARQLHGTIGMMLASSNRPASGDRKTGTDNSSTSTSRPLSPEAESRGRSTLRKLLAMTEGEPRLPDNLPVDYRPFEDVA